MKKVVLHFQVLLFVVDNIYIFLFYRFIQAVPFRWIVH